MKCLYPLTLCTLRNTWLSTVRSTWLSTVLVLGIAGCSGGIEGTGASGGGNKGNNATISEGTITGFGSIFVNGVEYETSTADIAINKQSAAELALKLGMLVRVEGVVDADGLTGTALSVSYNQNLEGPINSITTLNSDNKLLNILGVTVDVKRSAVFDNITFDSLLTGQVVEVSGYRKADGGVIATRVENIDMAADYEVEARITSLDKAGQLFNLGSLVVNYSLAEFEGVTPQTLAAGQFLQVTGSLSGSPAEFYATHIEFDDPDDAFAEGDEVHLEGIIDNFSSASAFTISGYPISAANAEYENGNSGNLADGVLVEVEGQFNAANTLIADSVHFIPQSEGAILAPIDSVNVDQRQLTVLGETFAVAEFTFYEDDSESDVQYFNLADLSVGQWVQLHISASTGTRYITFLKRVNAEDKSHVEGPIASINGTLLTIYGIAIDVSNIEASVRDSFAIGTIIEAEGSFVGGVLVAESAESDQ